MLSNVPKKASRLAALHRDRNTCDATPKQAGGWFAFFDGGFCVDNSLGCLAWLVPNVSKLGSTCRIWVSIVSNLGQDQESVLAQNNSNAMKFNLYFARSALSLCRQAHEATP